MDCSGRFLDCRFIKTKNFGGLIHHLCNRLADRGERVGRPICHWNVVKSDHRDIVRDTEICSTNCVDPTDRHNIAREKYAVRLYILSNEAIGRFVPCVITEGTTDFMGMECNAQLGQAFGKTSSPIQIRRRITLAADIRGSDMSRFVKIFRYGAAAGDIIAANCRHLETWNIAVKQHNWNLLRCAHGCHP